MTAYPPGPFLLEIPYVYAGLSHDVTVNCDAVGTPTVGSDPTTVFLETKDGAGATLDDSANALWDLIRVFFLPATGASAYTLWKCNPDNSERLFISGGALVHPNGGGTGVVIPSSEVIFTWRSAGGNYLKIELLEHTIDSQSRAPLLSTGLAPVNALSAFVLGPSSFVMARDRSFPVVAMNASFGQDEATWRRRNRA